jgi:hypothetical protein
MSDEQKIVIANNEGGVINVLIIGSNPIVISDPNITEPGEVLPPGDNVDNSTITSPNNAIDVTAAGEVLPPGDNVDNSTIISPISLRSFIASFVRDFLAGSVIVLAVLVILSVLISFWPYILAGGLLLLIVTVLLRLVWVWLKDQLS